MGPALDKHSKRVHLSIFEENNTHRKREREKERNRERKREREKEREREKSLELVDITEPSLSHSSSSRTVYGVVTTLIRFFSFSFPFF